VQDDYTRQHKEAVQALLRGYVDEIVEGVATCRGLARDKVGNLRFSLGNHKLLFRV
jgi:hypothetical protein